MKNILSIFVFFFVSVLFSQKTCDKKEESLENLSPVSKCSITNNHSFDKKTSVLKVKVSTSKANFLKKRSQDKDISKEIINFKNSLSSKELKRAKKFNELSLIPVFKKCKETRNKERIKCFNGEMIKHINAYYFYPSEAVKNNVQGTIWVRFVIDEMGDVSNIKTIGNSNTTKLKEVAKYIVAKLPQFSPAVFEGKAVSSKYGFPIDFSLENK